MRYSKFKIADFKYSKHFVKLQHKNTQIQQFGLKFKVFCFAWNFAFWKIRGWCRQVWQDRFFKSLLKNAQIRYFWSQFQSFLLFCEKICDFINLSELKCDNSFLKSRPKSTQIKPFWSQGILIQNLKLFLDKTLCVDNFDLVLIRNTA